MGIVPDIEFGNDCGACFAAGETPKFMHLEVAGMKNGNLWLPMFGPPPNGLWILTQQPNPCEWRGAHGTRLWLLWIFIPGSRLIGGVHDVFQVFHGFDVNNCHYAFGNLLNDWLTQVFYGGSAQISWV